MKHLLQSADLARHAAEALDGIRSTYEASLRDQQVQPRLLIDIKNYLENLRSALDYAAAELFRRFGSSSKPDPRIYFPYAAATQTRQDFDSKKQVERCIPGITASRADIATMLTEFQHFGTSAQPWLPAFMDLINENKHERLTPQKRSEIKQLRVDGGGASMSIGEGASISIGEGASIRIGGAVIQGGQQFDVNRPPRVQGGRVEVITWVYFRFENGEIVMPFLERSLAGVQTILSAIDLKI